MKLDGVWIGDFDILVVIEQASQTKDSVTGEAVSTWTTFASVWANRMKVSTESFEASQQVTNRSSKWGIRWISGVTEQMRVNDHGVYHYIKGIEEQDRKKILVLTTEERDNG